VSSVDVPQPIKTVTAVSLIGYGVLIYQQADDFELALPITPALHAEPAYTGGTAVVKGEGGFFPRPPDAPIRPDARPAIWLDS
jgi:hypothetical protein